MTDSPTFRSVLRGYEPTQVDQVIHELRSAVAAARQEAAERTVEVSKLSSLHDELRQHVAARDTEIATLHAAQRRASATWSRRAGSTCQRPAAVGQPRASDTVLS